LAGDDLFVLRHGHPAKQKTPVQELFDANSAFSRLLTQFTHFF
jgi:hypothetical protein